MIPYYERFLATLSRHRARSPRAAWIACSSTGAASAITARASPASRRRRRSSQRMAARFRATWRRSRRLPGIGRSTAAAIAAFAFGARGAILDGNVRVLLARHRGIAGIRAREGRGATVDDRGCALPNHDIEIYTQALMDLGATVCTRTMPRCENVPGRTDCVARREDRIAELPVAASKKRCPQRAVRVLLLERAGDVHARKATGDRYLGGVVEPAGDRRRAERRSAHCKASFAAHVVAGETLPPIEHGFTHYRLTIHPQRIAVRKWPSRA